MDQYEWVRTAHRVYKKSIRQIARETGHTRRTVRKVLAGQDPKYRREKEPACPVMDPVAGIVEGWLRADREQPAKQRHTAHRVWRRLVDEHGFTGAEPTVRRWVRERKMRLGWHRPGAVVPLDPEQALEAEVDWGTAWVRMKGEDVQVKLFCMRSRYSGKSFVRAYPRERQEMFLDGHIRAFDWYGGVFPTVVFDNLKTAVRRILRGKARIEQDRFTALRAHYTFESRFCNPARGQEKGGVEGLVGFARRNFLVPVPEVADFEELNAQLLERCATDDQRRIGGRSDARTIGERHAAESERLLALPETPFENTKVVGVRISRYQTAQVDSNRYSVPTAYVGRRLWAHIGCDRVRFYADQKKVAEHARAFGHSDWRIDPLHYLELIRRKVASFESARPIRQWRPQWPAHYEAVLERLRDRHGYSRGTREFIGILQLHSVVAWTGAEMEFALSQAIASGDAFEHRPSECGHCVQDFLADLDLRDLPGEAAGFELGADDTLPTADLRFYPAALVVPCGHLPGHAAVAADLGNMAIPNRRIPRRLRADHCVLRRRYNHIQDLPIPMPQQIPCRRPIIGAVSQKARDRGIQLIQEPG